MQVQQFAGKKLGFTLVEIITIIVILSILVTAAIPSYEDFIRNNDAMTMADRLADSFRLAQGEAIKRGIPVTVCPIDATFNPTSGFNEITDQYPCASTSTWSAWKIFTDPDYNASENFSNGWPVIQYVKNQDTGSISSNISGPITYDPLGFANVDPSVMTASWTWSSSFSSGDWEWSYGYNSQYAGADTRTFLVAPAGCTGNNARQIVITQNGVIEVTTTSC